MVKIKNNISKAGNVRMSFIRPLLVFPIFYLWILIYALYYILVGFGGFCSVSLLHCFALASLIGLLDGISTIVGVPLTFLIYWYATKNSKKFPKILIAGYVLVFIIYVIVFAFSGA